MENYFTNSKSKVVDSDRVLYTASNFARSSLFHLQEIGRLKALKPHVSNHTFLPDQISSLICSLLSRTAAGSLNITAGNMSLKKAPVFL